MSKQGTQTSPEANTSDSRPSQANGTYNQFLNDVSINRGGSSNNKCTNHKQKTQVIPFTKPESLIGSNSQPSRIQNLRVLSENEDNRIIDSSCDFKDSISTQALLDKEPDTVVIKEDIPVTERNEDESIRLSTAESSAPFKNLKLPDGESPWLSRVKDPFNDSETPWLNKIRDPFKETPINEKVLDAMGETPNSTRKVLVNSLNTPSAAHKIFQKLREKGNQKELDFDSQTVPELFKDTQPPSLEKEHEGSNNDVTMDLNHEIDSPRKDHFTDDVPTQVVNDTLIIGDPNQHSEPQDPKSDNTQADIQVPGTAPEVDHSLVIENDEISKDLDAGESSPINSDDEKNFSLDYGRRLHSEPVSGDYLNILAEDSIQKYHRDLTKRGLQLENQSKSFAGDTQRISQSKRLNSLPLNLDTDTLHQAKITVQGNKNTQEQGAPKQVTKSHLTSSPNVEESSPAIREKADTFEIEKAKADDNNNIETNTINTSNKSFHSQAVDFNALAENITQEFSDVDDESKVVDNTIEEEADNLKLQTEWNEGTSKSSNPVIRPTRNSKRKKSSKANDLQLQFTSSPDKSINHSDLSIVLDANTSQIDDNDHDISTNDQQSILTPEYDVNVLPNGILREETHNLSEEDIRFKDSVWCLANTRYYPGLILSLGKKGLEVKFFESTDEVNGGIFPLDIQIGDTVKIGRLVYLVTGLECVIQNLKEKAIRCMRGYDTVIVKRVKGKGKSMKILDTEEKFPLAEVHVENEEWHRRPRVLNEIKPKRSSINQVQQLKRIIPKTYEEELVLSTPKKPKKTTSDIFHECVFVITGEVDKDGLTKAIVMNGGTVLDDGFASMIDFSNGEPKSDAFKDFKFGALIAEKYSRSPKYLETVALGWPLLFEDFIYDCISDNKLLDNISTYLLASGESSKFRGEVKSADIFKFIQGYISKTDLSQQLRNNRILESKNVFICSKKNIEITQFLFKILGAAKVSFVPITNYTNLISTVTEHSYNKDILIYHDKISSLKSVLDHKVNDNKRRRIKKNSILSEVLSSNQKLQMELVDWEWLVQCVISRHPWKSQFKWSSK